MSTVHDAYFHTPYYAPRFGRMSHRSIVGNIVRSFTLIELLVVISIIGLLASTVFAALGGARGKARDAERQTEIREIYKALEFYYADHGSYPSTGSLNTVYADQGCAALTSPDQTRVDWVPGLVSGGYMSSLPKDPRGGYDTARNLTNTRACYMYASDGTYFLLSAWGTAEGGLVPDGGLYSRAGFRESVFSDQSYLCNHPNIGNATYGDYYRHSYTITNVGCTW